MSASILDWLAALGGHPQAQAALDFGGQASGPTGPVGPAALPDTGAQPMVGGGGGFAPHAANDPALYQWLQAQGAGMNAAELVPHAATQQEFMEGGYQPTAGAQPVDFESPMATDAQWGSQDRNAANTRHAEWEANRKKRR